ncbi:MAG: DUF167 family protein YggU [Deferrisomatales bacterium]
MPCRDADGGVVLSVWVQPRASRDQIVGMQGDALKVRIAAPPVDGEANAALTRFLAKTLRVPKRAVEIASGSSGRRKTVRIRGVAREEVHRLLGL